VKEGKLFAQATGQSEFAPKAKSETVFEFAPAQPQLEFDAPGSMIPRQGDRTNRIQEGADAMRKVWKGVSLLVVTAVTALAGDWPQFRGPGASGVGDGEKPPLRWDGAKGTNIVWKAEIPGLSVSSPITGGDRVYLTTAVSSDPNQKFRTGLYGDTDPVLDDTGHQWKVLALDKKTGKVLWRQTAHEGKPKTKRHPKSSQASPTGDQWQGGGGVVRL